TRPALHSAATSMRTTVPTGRRSSCKRRNEKFSRNRARCSARSESRRYRVADSPGGTWQKRGIAAALLLGDPEHSGRRISGKDRRQRRRDPRTLLRRDETAQSVGKPRLTDAGDDVLPAIGREHAGANFFHLDRTDGSAADLDEVMCVGGGLRLQDPVDRTHECDQVIDRRTALFRRELGVLPLPFELVEDRVL